MKPTDILSNEHRMIEQVLGCLEKMAEEAEACSQLDLESAGLAIEFARGFADAFHHSKEETCFFPAMETKGFPRTGGPTGVMLHEHELGRQRVAHMSEELAAATEGSPTAVERFAEHARAFVTLLRDHIEKEDHCLFNMANMAFTPDEQEGLVQAFVKAEAEYGADRSQGFAVLAEQLGNRFQVPRAKDAGGGGLRCCGH